MTSDAKIGLLLGLVFIFAIAFLINGLPSFTQADGNNELTTNMVTSVNNGDINEASSNREFTEREITGNSGDRDNYTTERRNYSANTTARSANSVTEREKVKKDVRFERKLPTKELNTTLTRQKEVGSTKSSSAEKSTSSNTSNLPTTYTVEKGDRLAEIAVQFYGSKAGNKLKNIDKIYEANSDKLDSQNDIHVGQTLRIPSLEAGDGSGDKSMVNKVSDSINSLKDKLTENSNKKRYYTVEEGDNLWKIAYKCLGDGSRYKDIKKVNSDILESKDHLTVGMKLVIPPK